MAMVTWKTRKIKKQTTNKNEGSGSKSKVKQIFPPPEGWPGGRPEDNGYRHK